MLCVPIPAVRVLQSSRSIAHVKTVHLPEIFGGERRQFQDQWAAPHRSWTALPTLTLQFRCTLPNFDSVEVRDFHFGRRTYPGVEPSIQLSLCDREESATGFFFFQFTFARNDKASSRPLTLRTLSSGTGRLLLPKGSGYLVLPKVFFVQLVQAARVYPTTHKTLLLSHITHGTGMVSSCVGITWICFTSISQSPT